MIRTIKNPISVNFLGGPGISKSSLATMLFSELKWLNLNAEYVGEYAKTKTWEKSPLSDQIYIFGKQQHAMEILRGQVDIIVTDSPLLISHLYYSGGSNHFKHLIREVYDSYTNINILLERVKPYHKRGRSQSPEQARELDDKMHGILIEQNVPYHTMRGERQAIPKLVELILDKLKEVETVAQTEEKELKVAALVKKGFPRHTAELLLERVPELLHSSFLSEDVA